jgi:tryptophanyl-tRNA synthetase
VEEPKNPDECQIFTLYKLFADKNEQTSLADRYRKGGMGWGEAKEELFRVVNRLLAPMREKYDAIMADIPSLDNILRQGAEKARPIAAATVKRFRLAAGIDYRLRQYGFCFNEKRRKRNRYFYYRCGRRKSKIGGCLSWSESCGF